VPEIAQPVVQEEGDVTLNALLMGLVSAGEEVADSV
jgi:hypothetical protein